MKWSGLVGLLLMATLCTVYTLPTQTTTIRYTSLQGYNRFSLHTTRNSDKEIPQNLSTSNISPYLSDFSLRLNFINLTRQIRTAKQPKDDKFFDDVLTNTNNFKDSSEVGRKLRRKPSKNQNTLRVVGTNNKTLKINTVNKVTTKVNKHSNIVNTKLVSKTSNVRVPNTKKNSSIVLNAVKKGGNVVTTKAPFRIKVIKVTTTTTKSPKIAFKTSSSTPFVIKLTRFTTAKPKITTQRYAPKQTEKPVTIKLSRPSLKNSTSGTKKKDKPIIHKIITKWSDTTDLSEVKQNWYEDGVPYPNPNPEISTFSPPVSLSDVSSISPIVNDFSEGINYPSPNPGIDSFSPSLNPEISSYSPPFSLSELSSISPLEDDILENDSGYVPSPTPEVSSYSPPYSISDVPPIIPDLPDVSDAALSIPSSTAISNPISVFNIDMIPDGTKQADSGGSPCPTVHISSSLLASRQMECSDLNLVINSHFHQNQNGGGTRNPEISTYDAAAGAPADPIVEDIPLAEEGAVVGEPNSGGTIGLADPGVGGAEAAVPEVPAAAVPSAGTGGTGGTGGSGGDGSDGGGGLKFPDLKNLFEAIGYLWNKLGHLLSFLRNPYLYIIPMALFFALSFFTILALFPWWIPLLLIYLGVKSNKKPKETVAFYNHVHKPVHHPDGWFWNHQTKTWQNVQDFVYKRSDHGDKRVGDIEAIINSLKNKYENNKLSVQTWKRRKRLK